MGYADSAMVDVEGTLKAQTANACLIDDGKVEAWIPSSQMEEVPDADVGSFVTVTMPQWLAYKKGFV